MLTLSIIIVILAALWFIARLWAIRKHDRVLHNMYDYRREVTGLMRSKRVEQINESDYKKLRKTLDNANIVIEDYEKRGPSLFSFYHTLIGFGKKAYRADVQQQRQDLAQNEEVKHQQTNFRKLLSWSVYYNTPYFFRNKNLLSVFLSLFGCSRKGSVLKKSETYSDWLERNVSSPLSKDFSPRH